MTTNMDFLGLIIGLIIGGIAVWLILNKQIKQKETELTALRKEMDTEKQAKVEAQTRLDEFEKQRKFFEDEIKEKFSFISLDALDKNSKNFLELAKKTLESQTIKGETELENKKKLIDKSVQEIDKTLAEVKKKIEDVGRGSAEVTTLVKTHTEITSKLKDTTEHLREALASSKKRGEWGERMAQDILKLVGLVEGINYTKQKTLENSAGRPDYTFFLPNNLKVNMDVKFPLENYQHYLDAHTEHDKKRFKEELLKNTRIMIKQTTNRAYINSADNTVDYVIVFIPNEQVYSFINEADPAIMDEALKQKVILCSPFTLYAVLAVIRQAVENFNLGKTASEILKLLGEFSKQWYEYKKKFASMGEKIDAARKEYDALLSTRVNMLERPIKKIDELRKQQSIEFDEDVELDETSLID
ncbi:MAG: DNA recombination protein RmuC [Nitrospirota bacterium]